MSEKEIDDLMKDRTQPDITIPMSPKVYELYQTVLNDLMKKYIKEGVKYKK